MLNAHMAHPSPQQLADYGLGKLSSPELLAVTNHLNTCEKCRRQVEEQPPDSFIGRLRAGAPQGGTVPPCESAMPLASPGSKTSLYTGPSSEATCSTVEPISSEANTVPPRPEPAADNACEDVPAELAASSKYQVLGKLGQGGMGAVYKAKHNFLGEVVAIKVMSAQALGNTDARARFLREMQAAGKLKHRNIVRALDAEQLGETLVLVMEYVAGITLDELVKQRGPLPREFACACIVQAALGLQHAHEKDMIHRDIKPANLMVAAKEKEVKLVDFGLARGPRAQMEPGNQTQMQTFMGTPEYVAPEQATDARNADIRADVYSLGCTLYYLLAGRPPFQADNLLNTILAHIQDEATPLTEVRPELPSGLWAVVARMLAKRPEDRYQAPAEVAEALRPFAVAAKAVLPGQGALSAKQRGAVGRTPLPSREGGIPPLPVAQPIQMETPAVQSGGGEESPFTALEPAVVPPPSTARSA